jgi:hypothetical protein
MKIFKSYNDFLNERSSGEIFEPKRGKPTKFDHTKYPELEDELFNLISTAYAEIGGHAKIKVPADVTANTKWDFWEGIDIHGSQDFDIIMFGQKTKYGLKFSGVGHDGTRDAKKAYMNQRGNDLKKIGHYIEVSGKIAEILIHKYKVPVVTDQATVEKVLGKKLDWQGSNSEDPNATGNGWYIRTLGGHNHQKILLGRPKI